MTSSAAPAVDARPQPRVHALARRLVQAGWRGAPLVWRVAERIRGMPTSAVVRVAPHASVDVVLKDYVSALVYRGLYERAEVAITKALVDRGDAAVDVGANIGFFTALLASQVGGGGRVLAFEPGPVQAAMLRRAVRWMPPCVTVLEHALGSGERSGVLYVADDTQLGLSTMRAPQEGRPIETHVRALDTVLEEQGVDAVAFLKVDVEGFEADVFAGAVDLLRSGRARSILAEVTPAFGPVDWAADVMVELGASYHCFEVQTWVRALRVRCRLRPFAARDVLGLEHQANLLFVRDDALPRVLRFVA